MNEDPLDLSPLAADAEERSARIRARVDQRIGAERDLWVAVRSRLARMALPAALAAAAGLAGVVLTQRRTEPSPDRFAVVVMGGGPATRWVVENQAPELSELVALMERAR